MGVPNIRGTFFGVLKLRSLVFVVKYVAGGLEFTDSGQAGLGFFAVASLQARRSI